MFERGRSDQDIPGGRGGVLGHAVGHLLVICAGVETLQSDPGYADAADGDAEEGDEGRGQLLGREHASIGELDVTKGRDDVGEGDRSNNSLNRK